MEYIFDDFRKKAERREEDFPSPFFFSRYFSPLPTVSQKGGRRARAKSALNRYRNIVDNTFIGEGLAPPVIERRPFPLQRASVITHSARSHHGSSRAPPPTNEKERRRIFGAFTSNAERMARFYRFSQGKPPLFVQLVLLCKSAPFFPRSKGVFSWFGAAWRLFEKVDGGVISPPVGGGLSPRGEENFVRNAKSDEKRANLLTLY